MTMKTFYNRTMELFLAQKGRCFYCNKPIDSKSSHYSKKGYTCDHFYPKNKKNHLPNNKVLSHYKCNQKKGDRDPNEHEVYRFQKLMKKMNERKNILKEEK